MPSSISIDMKSSTKIHSMNSVTPYLKATLFLSLLLNGYLFTSGPDFQSTGPCISTITSAADINGYSSTEENELRMILEKVAMPNKTLIVTYLNDAWIAPDSMFDLFLESFRIGDNTRRLLKHLLVVSLDEKAHRRCQDVHTNCYHLQVDNLNVANDSSYMSSTYLKIVWRKIELLYKVVSLGFNFVFTDGDIIWLRDPFPHLLKVNNNVTNLQVSCDQFYGNSTDRGNPSNTGFMYVESNPQTILFYKLWYDARKSYTDKHDQQVFNIMKDSPLFDFLGVKVRFLDTAYFSGICHWQKDFSKLYTVHGNCLVGMSMKVTVLRGILEEWRNYTSHLHSHSHSQSHASSSLNRTATLPSRS